MSFIRSYWWLIIVLAGVALVTLRVLSHANPTSGGTVARGRPVDQDPLRDPPFRLYLVILAAGAFVASQAARRFPLLDPSIGDYAIAAAIGIVVATGFALGRVPLFPGSPPPAGGSFLRSLLGLAFGALLGGSLLVIANGLLDAGPARQGRGVVTGRECVDGANAIMVRAPDLLDVANLIRITRHTGACREIEAGDTVFLAIKPGFLGRAWLEEARVQTAQERVRLLLDRRRARNR